jgi:hypothetical protein
MNDDFERIAGRTRTEMADLRRRDEQRRALAWHERVYRFALDRWWLIAIAVVLCLYLGLKR